MQVAFHFDEDALKDADKATERLLTLMRRLRLPVRSRLFIGSLLIDTCAQVQTKSGSTYTRTTDKKALVSLVNEWLSPQPFNWYALTPRAAEVVTQGTVHCNLYGTIEPSHALALHHTALKEMPDVYLGALQVDERYPSHLGGYQLVPWLRVDQSEAYVNWDGVDEDGKRPWVIEMLERAGFDPVDYENTSARFTILDQYEGAESQYRSAQCRAAMVELFDGVVDSSLVRVRDALPEVHERLWSIYTTFEKAENTEHIAHVALSCRRLIEYVADCLYPPRKTEPGERRLDQSAWKNRLLKYLKECELTETDNALVGASIHHTAACLDRLLELANKGVHASATREQMRRCILGIVQLLDDICAANGGRFAMSVKLDTDLVRRLATKSVDD